MKGFVGILAAAACAAALAGCGGGSDGEGEAIDYRAQANRICEQANKEWGARLAKVATEYPEGEGLTGTTRGKVMVKQVLLPPLEKMVASFSGLDLPPQGAEEVKAMIAGFEKALQEGKADYTRLDGGRLLASARDKVKSSALGDCR
jgi:hypothetical protein